MKRIAVAILLLGGKARCCYSLSTARTERIHSRRRALLSIICSPAIACTASMSAPFAFPPVANAKEELSDVDILKEAIEALSSLLDNWTKATVDCTYADVPRELLEAKNKEKLLEKASEFALFDKSTSVVSCKRTNRIVRDYIGATGKGPLVGIEKRLLRENVVDLVDPDRLDEYFLTVESFSQTMSRATSLAFMAGHNDFDAMNNFAEGKEDSDGSNLEQARRAIGEANTYLKRAVTLLTEMA